MVVTGLGVLAPNAHGLPAFAGALREGKSGIRFHQHLADAKFGCQVGGIPEDVEELQKKYLSDEELLRDEPQHGLRRDRRDRRVDRRGAEARPRRATTWSTGTPARSSAPASAASTPSPRSSRRGSTPARSARLGSTMVEQIMSSGNSARVAGLLGLGNQVSTNSSACNTGTEAVVDAFFRIREGRAQAHAGGRLGGHSKYIWAGFDGMKVLNRTKNDAPAEASRPMSASAAGFVPGSGAGVLMLESLESATARGARIYAEVLGGYVNCGGHRMGGSMTAPNPTSRAALHQGRGRDGGHSPRADRRHQRAPHRHLRRPARGEQLVEGARAGAGADAVAALDQVADRPRAGRGGRHRVRRLGARAAPRLRARLAQLRRPAPRARRSSRRASRTAPSTCPTSRSSPRRASVSATSTAASSSRSSTRNTHRE